MREIGCCCEGEPSPIKGISAYAHQGRGHNYVMYVFKRHHRVFGCIRMIHRNSFLSPPEFRFCLPGEGRDPFLPHRPWPVSQALLISGWAAASGDSSEWN